MIGTFELQLNEHTLFERVIEQDDFLRTTVRLTTPGIFLLRPELNSWGEVYRELGIRVPTLIVFHASKCFWSFQISILGFGIGISHQNGY